MEDQPQHALAPRATRARGASPVYVGFLAFPFSPTRGSFVRVANSVVRGSFFVKFFLRCASPKSSHPGSFVVKFFFSEIRRKFFLRQSRAQRARELFLKKTFYDVHRQRARTTKTILFVCSILPPYVSLMEQEYANKHHQG